jgi:hypothetical protein
LTFFLKGLLGAFKQYCGEFKTKRKLVAKRKVGFGALLEELEQEEEVYIPRSYVVCPACKDEFRSDEFPRKEDEKISCSCSNLELGCIEGDGHPCKVGVKNGFITIRYKKEYPKFVDKDI